MTAECELCSGVCADADLTPLLAPELRWLWEGIAAAADRRGDPELAMGHVQVRAPGDPAERAAAVGLLGGRPLSPGRSRSVDLTALTVRLKARGEQLTPGAVAAHATCRRLAVRARERERRTAADARLRDQFAALLEPLLQRRGVDVDNLWASLRRNGWVARLHAAGGEAPFLLDAVCSVVLALPSPGRRADRRVLANTVLHDPHGLDDGSRVTGLVLGLLSALGDVPTGERHRRAWNLVGVDYDDLTGGLVSLGVHPVGWSVPIGSVLTLPPRELARCIWPSAPDPAPWVFVTENPSVLAMAADAAVNQQVGKMLCTVGTPSELEVHAIARLARAGWRVAVRADFDMAGLAHVETLLTSVPGAVPWRMGVADYLLSLDRAAEAPEIPDTAAPTSSWCPELTASIRAHGRAAYEETLHDELLHDLLRGTPDTK
ncbi:DUF2399 domain-containing protein [Actinomadura rupiterrae]|uniref:DUF2399 domain-containing protein n=1 Tax=Actinomadura rupiterrae TaxID=559627 RepID=UPI0020A3F5FC|nr:DUF2399 domain-containing protein [Actinomadura rupiterrae]MCP2342996.1 uncharacterized protein (TIGR02679 family) [Actinomadura rupiterrae]